MSTAFQLKKISEKPWFYPAALLLIGFIVYGYCLPYLGFYWDDWEVVMFTKLSPALQSGFYASDRPFPWPSQLTYLLVGSNPIGWHIVALLLRWAGILLLVYALTFLWPRYASYLRWLGALLLVYPGFLQQAASTQYDRHFSTFFLFALSIYLMFQAVRQPRWAWILFPLSWIATLVHLFTMEYFIGLELIRVVLLWMIVFAVHRSFLRSLGQTVIQYLPYALITAFYFWWRFIIFPGQAAGHAGDLKIVREAAGSLTDTLSALLTRAFLDLLYSVVQVWTTVLSGLQGFTFQSRITLLAVGLGVVLTAIFAVFQDARENDLPERSTPFALFAVGLLGFLLAAFPVWAIGKQITGGGRWDDRFTLAPMLGAGLVVIALLLWLVRASRHRLVLSILLVFSVATQVLTVNRYRLEWGIQSATYWQLYWRAPALQPGTAVLSLEQPSISVTEDDASFALNLLYHGRAGSDGSLPYWYFTSEPFLSAGLRPGMALSRSIRDVHFQGSTSASLAFLHPTGSACLRMLDQVYADDPLYTDGQGGLIPVSNLARIQAGSAAAAPDPNIFGTEPAHDWCYFFEKADLARQAGDWNSVLALSSRARQAGLMPQYGAEYLPAILASAQTGDWQGAYGLTMSARKLTPGLEAMLCSNWARLAQSASPDKNVIAQVRQALSCKGL